MVEQDETDWLLSRIAGTHTCASKQRIPFPPSQEAHPAAPSENPPIEAPIAETPGASMKPPHAAVEAPAEDPAHEIMTRERDTGAQVSMQTQVFVPHAE
jgi:hypothetical protein